MCAFVSFIGSLSYAVADTFATWWAGSFIGPITVLTGRFLQGVGSGGQQAVEQSYLSIAAPPEQRTELTGKLATAATLGFIFGPALGAAVGQTPAFSIGPFVFNTYTKQGWVVALLYIASFLMTTFVFTEVARRWQKLREQQQSGRGFSERSEAGATPTSASSNKHGNGRGRMDDLELVPAEEASVEDSATLPSVEEEEEVEEPMSTGRTRGVWALIIFFFIHFNGFAVQETITTPLVNDWFGWDDMAANLLFTAAGVVNLLCALVMAALSSQYTRPDGTTAQVVDDRMMLLGSMALALFGWLVMVPPDGWAALTMLSDAQLTANGARKGMGLTQFSVGFSLVTIAFPFGRGLCLAMVGKLLGDRPQGAWMGIMLALGAIARIVGPFWAVQGYYWLGAIAVFGSTAVLFLLSLIATRVLWSDLSDASSGGVTSPTSPRNSKLASPRLPRSAGSHIASIHDHSSPRLVAQPGPSFDDDRPAPMRLPSAS